MLRARRAVMAAHAGDFLVTHSGGSESEQQYLWLASKKKFSGWLGSRVDSLVPGHFHLCDSFVTTTHS